MDLLIQEVESLKNNLDQEKTIKDILDTMKKIKTNKELVEKIEKYHKNPNEELKQAIYSYEEIKEYKHLENDVNLIILELRKELKKVTNKRSC